MALFRGRREFQYVSRLRTRIADRTCGKFKYGMSGQTSRDAPGSDGTSHLLDLVLSVQVYKIDRKAHEERVHRFAGHNPQPFAGFKAVAAQQSFGAPRTAVSYF